MPKWYRAIFHRFATIYMTWFWSIRYWQRAKKTVLISGLTSWFSQSSPYYIFCCFYGHTERKWLHPKRGRYCRQFFGEHFYGTFRSNKEHFFSIFQWIGSDHLHYKVTLVQIESRGENDLLGALEALTLEIKSETDSNNFTDCFGRGGGKKTKSHHNSFYMG